MLFEYAEASDFEVEFLYAAHQPTIDVLPIFSQRFFFIRKPIHSNGLWGELLLPWLVLRFYIGTADPTVLEEWLYLATVA